MDYKNKELCRLRTISFFLTLHKDKSQWESALYSVKRDVDLLLPAVQKAGYTLQSIRVITNPFGEYLDLTLAITQFPRYFSPHLLQIEYEFHFH